jgi:hypothetical protein
MSSTLWWKQPLAGEIVWTYFPDDLQTKPAEKPRPALILTVYDDKAPQYAVLVAYGTSRGATQLYSGEFAITKADQAAYKAAGLSFDTKFNLVRRLQSPFSDEFFAVPPRAPHGQLPKLGVLHPALMKRAAGAWKAAVSM